MTRLRLDKYSIRTVDFQDLVHGRHINTYAP